MVNDAKLIEKLLEKINNIPTEIFIEAIDEVYREDEKMNRKYYKRINNLDIGLEKTNHKYIMINQWAIDNSHKWGIATFKYNEDEDYWYLQTYGNFNHNVDWYDFGYLVRLGYKWIKDGCLYDNPELLGGE